MHVTTHAAILLPLFLDRLLRPRRSVDYNSEGTSSSILTVESASKWKEETVFNMNIKVVDKNKMLEDTDLTSEAQLILIPEWKNKEWLEGTNIEPYDKKTKTLMFKIKDVSVNNFTESLVDGFMGCLLNYLNFDDYPCFIYSQHSYSIRIGPESSIIRATPDLSVITRQNSVMLVIEDKAPNSTSLSNRWKEDQVLGELFVAVHYLAEKTSTTYPITAYAARVIGTKFTFYKTTVTMEYINESTKFGMSKQNEMIVHRCPLVEEKRSLTAYDICNEQDRRHILESLCHIKARMTS